MTAQTKFDPYATAEESTAVMSPDTRTPAEKLVDQMLEGGGASEQGAEYGVVLRQVATKLAERVETGKAVWRQDQARIADLMTQQDELLGVLGEFDAAMTACSDYPDMAHEIDALVKAVVKARAAMAKAEGKA